MKPKHPTLALLLSVLASILLVHPLSGQADTEVHYGPLVAIGDGTARSYLAIDGAGKPVELGVLFSAGALQGLPSAPTTRAHLAL